VHNPTGESPTGSVTDRPRDDGYNHDQQNSVIDGVKDAVVANSESVTLTPAERPRGRGPRILSE